MPYVTYMYKILYSLLTFVFHNASLVSVFDCVDELKEQFTGISFPSV
jgi:hypothetical protein